MLQLLGNKSYVYTHLKGCRIESAGCPYHLFACRIEDLVLDEVSAHDKGLQFIGHASFLAVHLLKQSNNSKG